MIPARIEGADKVLIGQDDVVKLHVRCEQLADGTPCVVSSWEPTPEEVELIRRGAKVHLWVAGATHPPVYIAVGEES